jgi:hypothetical protein
MEIGFVEFWEYVCNSKCTEIREKIFGLKEREKQKEHAENYVMSSFTLEAKGTEQN